MSFEQAHYHYNPTVAISAKLLSQQHLHAKSYIHNLQVILEKRDTRNRSLDAEVAQFTPAIIDAPG